MSESTSASTGCSIARRSPHAWPTDGISYTEFSYQLLQSFDFVQLYRRFGCTLQTGRFRPVGQHRRGGGPHPAHGRGQRARAHDTPHDEVGRHQVRQDRVRHRLARSRPDQPLRVLPVLAELRRPGCRVPPAHVQLPEPGGDRRAAGGRGRATAGPRGPAGPRERADSHGPRGGGARRGRGGRAGAVRPGRAGDLPAATLSAALAEAPNVEIPGAEIIDGLLPSYDELFARTGLAASKSAARRTIDEGGAYANNVRVTDAGAQPAMSDLHHGEWLVLRRGKKAFAGVRVARP